MSYATELLHLYHPFSLNSEWVEIYQYLLTIVMKDKVPEELRRRASMTGG